jgi:hypothetical protein
MRTSERVWRRRCWYPVVPGLLVSGGSTQYNSLFAFFWRMIGDCVFWGQPHVGLSGGSRLPFCVTFHCYLELFMNLYFTDEGSSNKRKDECKKLTRCAARAYWDCSTVKAAKCLVSRDEWFDPHLGGWGWPTLHCASGCGGHEERHRFSWTGFFGSWTCAFV